MTQFVLDASVTLAWIFSDESTEYSESVQNSLKSASALAPAIWPLEIANVLLSAERRGRITAAKITSFLRDLDKMPISIDSRAIDRRDRTILTLAREHSLTTYDAAYLEVAIRLGQPIATLDKALVRSANAAKVPIYASHLPEHVADT